MIEDAEVVATTEGQALAIIDSDDVALAQRNIRYKPEDLAVMPEAFEFAQRVARILASLGDMLPKHLMGKTQKETIANCMFLVADATRWVTNPWALMGDCYPKPGGGGMAYQAKVFTGLATRLLGVRLNYRFTGAGEERGCAAYGTIPGEAEERTTPPVIFKQAVTRDRDGQVKAAWRNDPDTKLSYNAVMRWMRMHAPELVTGAFSAEDADLIAEERRAALPATPAAGATPQTLRDFVEITSVPRQEATGPTQPLPAPASPAGPEPPGATFSPPAQVAAPAPAAAPPASAPASRRAVTELQKLAKDNQISAEELEILCRAATQGRGLAKLLDVDLQEVVEEVLRTGKDRKRGA